MTSRRVWANLLLIGGIVLLLIAGGTWAYAGLTSRRPAPTPTPWAQPATSTAEATQPTPLASPSATETWIPTPTGTRPPTSSTVVALAVSATSTLTPPLPSASPTASITARPSHTPTTAGAFATPDAPRLSIPRLEVNAHIVEVTWHVLETNDGVFAEWDTAPPNEIGHHLNSAAPGTPGNCVMAGHGQDGAVLARLDELAVGDEIWITLTNERKLRYRVSEVLRLAEMGVSSEERLQNAQYLQDTQDARLTLISCWPGWAYTHRIVIIAKLVG